MCVLLNSSSSTVLCSLHQKAATPAAAFHDSSRQPPGSIPLHVPLFHRLRDAENLPQTLLSYTLDMDAPYKLDG